MSSADNTTAIKTDVETWITVTDILIIVVVGLVILLAITLLAIVIFNKTSCNTINAYL
jgi:hypothetical protein